ncbi:hypothetical protein Ae201684P_018707 [Aphanomyces euteiches]|nr:hypothetical protein Ae201684P_018707 [Aphanomyces euteiches]
MEFDDPGTSTWISRRKRSWRSERMGNWSGSWVLLWMFPALARDAKDTPEPNTLQKSILSLGRLIEAYKLVNSLDEKMLNDLQLIRAKFKVVTALLGQKHLVFNETLVEEHKNLSF